MSLRRTNAQLLAIADDPHESSVVREMARELVIKRRELRVCRQLLFDAGLGPELTERSKRLGPVPGVRRA